MMMIRRVGPVAAVLAATAAFAGCRSILPEEGPSRLALRDVPVVASSGQRLGPDGYPLLGAFPNSANAQIDNTVLQSERGGLQTAASTQNAGAASASAAYQRQLGELQAVKAAQRKSVDAALAGTSAPASGETSDPDAVLREIEGAR